MEVWRSVVVILGGCCFSGSWKEMTLPKERDILWDPRKTWGSWLQSLPHTFFSSLYFTGR